MSHMSDEKLTEIKMRGDDSIAQLLSLADWRQKMASLYQRIIQCDDLAAIWPDYVATRQELYRTHPQSPMVGGDKEPQFFPYNQAMALSAKLLPLRKPISWQADGGKDGLIDFTSIAQTDGLSDVLGQELTLYQFNHYGGGLFLPFGDRTNGTSSYGGGRYLIDNVKSAYLGMTSQQHIRLDFNFAYFPSCAHNHDYLCPLSPSQNKLAIAIEAGERWPDEG
ncbi:MAG: DUF1684 domain-containing protein [Candidatus Puniceispirillaceae bacterium]